MKLSILLIGVLFSSSIFANNNQPLFDSCLSLKNSTQSLEAQPCRFFIEGFMAASYLTGVPVASNHERENSAFFNRAYDNRLGITSVEKRQKACEVPQNQERIIADVSSNIPNTFESVHELKSLIINALKKNQTCGLTKR